MKDWKQIDSILTNQKLPLVEQTWPDVAKLNSLEAFKIHCKEQSESLARKLGCLALLKTPVIAVAGLINAGKSSFVCNFLSPAGRKRVLYGIDKDGGTHRFTLWAPEEWKVDTEKLDSLKRMLSEVSGTTSEDLSSDAETARRQQHQSDDIFRPLLAFDPALDKHGLCLLDCPDIERHDKSVDQSRRAALENFSQICSGIVMIVTRARIETKMVSEVQHALPNASFLLAVNRIPGDQKPDIIIKEIRNVLQKNEVPIYVAYDFRDRDYKEITPNWDPNLTGEAEKDWPCYFKASTNSEENIQDAISEDRGLRHPAELFPPDQIVESRLEAMSGEFAEELRECLKKTDENLRVHTDMARKASKKLVAQLADLLMKDGKPVVKIDGDLFVKASKSTVETAPWDIKLLLKTSGLLGKGRAVIADTIKSITPDLISNKITWLYTKMPGSKAKTSKAIDTPLSKPEVLAKKLSLWSTECRGIFGKDVYQSEKKWEPVASQILKRFRDEERTSIPSEDLREITSEFWKTAPKWKTRTAVLGGLGVALVALLLIPLDGGVSLVALNAAFVAKLLAFFGIKGTIISLTSVELLGAIGATSILGVAASQRLADKIDDHLADQQHSNFKAIVFDEVALPRHVLSNEVTKPTIEEKLNVSGYGIETLELSVGEIIPENRQKINKIIDELASKDTEKRSAAQK